MAEHREEEREGKPVRAEDVSLEEVSEVHSSYVDPQIPATLKHESLSSKRSSKTADHLFDKIFRNPPSDYLALKLYGRIIPHKKNLRPGDSKWMIHPYSHFKYVSRSPHAFHLYDFFLIESFGIV